MTDAPRTDDERDELASAYLDGEASPVERALVEGDPDLQDRVAALARVRAALAAAPAPAAPVEDPVAAALAAARAPGGLLDDASPAEAEATAAPSESVVPLPAGRRDARRLRLVAVAAAVVAAAIAAPLLGRATDRADDEAATATFESAEGPLDDDLAGSADRAGGAAEAGDAPLAADAAAPVSGAPVAVDLGAHSDLAALHDAVEARLQAQEEAEAGGSDPSSTVAYDGGTTTTGAVCAGELEVPAGHEVLLEATAVVDGVPVAVVAHRAPGAEPIVVVATVEGCEVLSAGPR